MRHETSEIWPLNICVFALIFKDIIVLLWKLNYIDYETDSFIIQVTDGGDDDGMYDNESCPEV